MRKLVNLLLAGCMISLPLSAVAQTADPFGGAPTDDPFAAAPQADPFGGGHPRRADAKQAETKQKARPKAEVDWESKTDPFQDSRDRTERIRTALNAKTTQQFVEMPLQEVVLQLSQSHDIPIVINRRSLEEIGLSAEVPVTVNLSNVSLQSFLRLILQNYDLTYIVKDEVLQITTIQDAEQNLRVEMYGFPAELTEKGNNVVNALTSSVVPATWDVRGGPSSVSVIDNVLVVSTIETIHRDVADFMTKLNQAFEKRQAKE